MSQKSSLIPQNTVVFLICKGFSSVKVNIGTSLLRKLQNLGDNVFPDLKLKIESGHFSEMAYRLAEEAGRCLTSRVIIVHSAAISYL